MSAREGEIRNRMIKSSVRFPVRMAGKTLAAYIYITAHSLMLAVHLLPLVFMTPDTAEYCVI